MSSTVPHPVPRVLHRRPRVILGYTGVLAVVPRASAGRRTRPARRAHQRRHDEQRVEGADLVAEGAEQRRTGQEGAVADRRHHADPGRGAGGLVGGRAHPDREAEGGAEAPDQDAEPDEHARRRRPRPGRCRRRRRRRCAHRTGARPNRSRSEVPASRPSGHRGHEDRVAGDADPVLDVVPVDEREREPVVGRPLGHREAEDHQPDGQGARLQPGGAAARCRPRGGPPAGQERPGPAQGHAPAPRPPSTPRCSSIGTLDAR